MKRRALIVVALLGATAAAAWYWPRDRGPEALTLPGPRNGGGALAWSPSGARLAVAGDDAKIYLFDASAAYRPPGPP